MAKVRSRRCADFWPRSEGELGQALKRLENSLDAGKLYHPVIRGILLLENSGLNGSEVSAILATQQSSYDYDRVKKGLEEQWPNHRLFQRYRGAKKMSQAQYGDGCPWNFLETTVRRESGSTQEDPDDESAWSFWQEHDGWNTGWEESSWDSASS